MRRGALLQRLKDLKPFLADRGVVRLRGFGSHARDQAQPDSDVDLIADFDHRPSLLELVGIELELARRLGAPVNLATAAA
jgi:uncharacterized protein